jgi:AbrB family looped-hinge helix DNA binding protein
VLGKVTSKGQVTIPVAVRHELGLRPGDRIEFVKVDGHFQLRKHPKDSPWDQWVGFLTEYAGVDVDELIEDMRGR